MQEYKWTTAKVIIITLVAISPAALAFQLEPKKKKRKEKRKKASAIDEEKCRSEWRSALRCSGCTREERPETEMCVLHELLRKKIHRTCVLGQGILHT